MRVWDGQIAKGEMEALDYSGSGNNGDGKSDSVDAETIKSQFLDESKLGTKNKQGIYEVQDVDVSEDESDEDWDDLGKQQDNSESTTTKSSGSGGMFSFLKSITSQREVTNEALDPVLATMKDLMIKKNVAKEIAEHLCDSVRSSLLGKKLGSFERKINIYYHNYYYYYYYCNNGYSCLYVHNLLYYHHRIHHHLHHHLTLFLRKYQQVHHHHHQWVYLHVAKYLLQMVFLKWMLYRLKLIFPPYQTELSHEWYSGYVMLYLYIE